MLDRKDALILSKDEMVTKFDIIINTSKGMLFCIPIKWDDYNEGTMAGVHKDSNEGKRNK